MKILSRNLVIIIVITIIAVAGVVFLISRNNPSKTTAVNPTQIPSPAQSPSPEASTTGITAAYRAQVRTDFINDCSKKVGQNGVSECTCAADYLRAHYTDADLVKLYLQYQTSGKVPEEAKTAVDLCSSK